MMFSFACLCSSLTHAFALSREDYAFISPAHVRKRRFAYSLRDIVDDHSAVGIPVVHRSQRLISFLARSVPYLELDCGSVIE